MTKTKPTPDGVQDSQARLLVVDDDPKLLASLCPLLKNNGFQVDAVQDGRTACRRTLKHGYDLILLDMGMPGMNGLQLMSCLDKAELDVPIVVVSGMSSFGTVRKALRGGAYDYIKKPYNIDELVSTVRDALHKHRLERTRAAVQTCLRASEEFHRHAVNNLSDIVFTLDRQGRFCFLNNRIKSLLGYSSDDLIGRPFHQLMDEQDAAKAFVAFDSPDIGLDQPKTRELRLKTRGSQRANRYFEVTAFSLETGDSQSAGEPAVACFPACIFGVARDITERKEAEAFINFQASHDLLTRLPNRTLFQDRLILAMAHATRNNQRLAVMFLDLNRFKRVNDTLGHAIGDRLLQSIAQRLKGCLREEDTLSRFGGDEFTLLLPAIKVEDDARVTAVKLIRSLQEPFKLDGHEVYVGVSIGIAMFPEAGRTLDDLIQRADAAMYHVKRRGEDDYQFYR
jgi:diguanylate cyclase (GGDEF)-like protein/PAS domain S-box-containing protein